MIEVTLRDSVTQHFTCVEVDQLREVMEEAIGFDDISLEEGI